MFILALFFSAQKFPPEKASQMHVWVLALSIYVSILSGFGVLVVDLFRAVYEETKLGWVDTEAFMKYMGFTMLPVVLMTFLIGEVSCIGTFKSEGVRNPIDAQQQGVSLTAAVYACFERLLGGPEGILEALAFLSVVFYCLADYMGTKVDHNDHFLTYRELFTVDGIVLAVHLLMVLILTLGGFIPFLGRYAVDQREAFAGGFMGFALLAQNVAFAWIMTRSSRGAGNGNAKQTGTDSQNVTTADH